MKTQDGRKIERVICENHGGPECEGCPHNKIHTSADGGCKDHKTYCPNAFNDGTGGDVQCF